MGSMRVLVVEDEPYMAEAIRDWLRTEAIAADIAGDGDTALELLDLVPYDVAVLDRDIPGPSGDDIARTIVASGSGTPILMLTAADRTEGIEPDAGEFKHRGTVVGAAAVQGPQPEHEFTQFERLGEVVVGADLESAGQVVAAVRSTATDATSR